MMAFKGFLIFLVVIFGIVSFFLFISDYNEDLCCFFCICMIICIFLYTAISAVEKQKNESVETHVVECQDIKSFSLHGNSTSSTFGSFSLGCGYVVSNSSTKLEYYFYKMGQVGYVLCSIDAKRVEIVETDDKPPCIEGFFDDKGGLKPYETYIIYVPVGTIFEEYKVEL